MQKRLAMLAMAALVVLTGCDGLGDAMTAHTDVVARAAGQELTTEEAASLMAANPRLPAQPEVVEALANLWIDYTLLARAAADDSTLASIDLEPVIRPEMEQELVFRLREQVIQVDTALTDEELQRIFEEEQPSAEIRARHILVRTSPTDEAAQRDSARALAAQIRQQAVGGADFAALADQHNQPGAAGPGGDLGFFGRGEMVGPFEEAAFALDEGEISEVVETPFGYHVIKLEERRLPDFGERREEFRRQTIQQRIAEAEQGYIEGLTEPLSVEVEEGAYDVVRELAQNPTESLSRRAGSRALVTYRGGSLTANEFLDFMRRLAPVQRAEYTSAPDDQLERVLQGLTTNEILIQEARTQGIEISEASRDSLETQLRDRLRQAVAASELTGISAESGESGAEAVDRRVMSLLRDVVRGERQVLPLGPIAFTLRIASDAQIYERSYPGVVERVQSIRAETGVGELPGAPQPGAPPAGQGQPQPAPPQPQPAPEGNTPPQG